MQYLISRRAMQKNVCTQRMEIQREDQEKKGPSQHHFNTYEEQHLGFQCKRSTM